MIDVLDATTRRPHQRDCVVYRVDAHQGNIADPVADARVAYLGPKSFIARGIGGVETDMAEAGDARVTRREITPPTSLGSYDQFDVVAAGVAKSDERAH